jgi:hypothetical protein
MARKQPESYTVWERLEPVARDPDLQRSIRAEIRDPAWLLARQWQLGEFQGNDGGSPVAVDLEYVQEALTSVELPDRDPDAPPDATETVDYTPGESPPLETVVEREQVLTDEVTEPNFRVRAEAGLNFLSRLHDERRAASSDPTLPAPTDFDSGFRLDMSETNLDGPARRFELLAGENRTLDGYEIYKALDDVPGIESQAPSWSSVSPEDLPLPDDTSDTITDEFETAAKQFYGWYVDLYDEPDATTGDGWNEDRLEYEFEATTEDNGAMTTFEAKGYDGDGLDWDDMTVTDATAGSPTPKVPDPMPTPTRIRFNGMPKPRFWELEDANVDLSTLSAAPEDISWLTMAEIALTAGNRWFSLPLSVPYGSLTRITRFEVADTFAEHRTIDGETVYDGETTTIAAEAPTSPSQGNQPDEIWNAYHYDLPNKAEPGLLIPPVVGSALQSEPVERVRFARDEMANLAFAIEEIAEGPLGDPLERREFDRPDLEISDVHPSDDPDEEYVEFRNPGDDDLDLHDWKLKVEVATGTFDFDGNTLSAGGAREVYKFSDATIKPKSTLRLYTGGTSTHDTDDRLHVGADKPLWARGTNLRSYLVDRPRADPADPPGTVLEHPVGTTSESSLPKYRLATDVPDHWFPLKTKDTEVDDYRLEVALLMDASTLDDTIDKFPRPMGQVLSPHASVYDDAITEEGTTVEREYSLTMDAEGRRHLWSGRSVSHGSGEESSGLRFDFLDESGASGESE